VRGIFHGNDSKKISRHLRVKLNAVIASLRKTKDRFVKILRRKRYKIRCPLERDFFLETREPKGSRRPREISGRIVGWLEIM